jgi:hypothetical protein
VSAHFVDYRESMTPKLLRRRVLRRPFLATLAAVATFLPACGGRVENGNATPATTAPPPAADADVCPSVQPNENDPCTGVLSCSYGNCDYSPADAFNADCTNGAWSLSHGCNPPPPACPTNEPTGGTACSLFTAGGCGYTNACGTTTLYDCTGGTWAISSSSAGCYVSGDDGGDAAADSADAGDG